MHKPLHLSVAYGYRDARDLAAVFTPSSDEISVARRTARGAAAQLGFLVSLKLYQRLGRPTALAEAPRSIVEHVARAIGIPAAALAVEAYDRSGTQQRHLAAIRNYLDVRPYGPAARRMMISCPG